uniref:CCHC-type domain-containing protein n=1 Tax=Cacopsylla melanoneura TaxID=428564 RepID=A0A8D8Q0I4_9HEMI
MSLERALCKQKRYLSSLKGVDDFVRDLEHDSNNPVGLTLVSIRSNLELLRKEQNQFETLHLDILELKANYEDTEQISVFNRYLEESNNVIDSLRWKEEQLLDIRENSLQDRDEGSVASNGSMHTATSRQQLEGPHVKLPPIELPSFRGDSDQWLPFKDTFCALVQDNDFLTDVQKLHYLKSSLKGEALGLVGSLSSSGQNYKIAWTLLRDHYENKRLIINDHLKAIFEVPVVGTQDFKGFSMLANEVRKNLKAIEALEISVEGWDPLLLYIISNKLDRDTQREWETSISSNKEMPLVTELLDFLVNKGKVEQMLSSGKAEAFRQAQNIRPIQGPNRQGFKEQEVCLYCTKKGHTIVKCHRFLALKHSDRRDFITRERLCFICLSNKHGVAVCRDKPCTTCKGRHNFVLHEPSFRTQSQVQVEPSTASTSNNNVLLTTSVNHRYRARQESVPQEKTVSVLHVTSKSRVTQGLCTYCKKGGHSIQNCGEFSALLLQDRRKFVDRKGLCYICLSDQHISVYCKRGGCAVCKNKHNILLHRYQIGKNGSPGNRVRFSGTSTGEVPVKETPLQIGIIRVELPASGNVGSNDDRFHRVESKGKHTVGDKVFKGNGCRYSRYTLARGGQQHKYTIGKKNVQEACLITHPYSPQSSPSTYVPNNYQKGWQSKVFDSFSMTEVSDRLQRLERIFQDCQLSGQGWPEGKDKTMLEKPCPTIKGVNDRFSCHNWPDRIRSQDSARYLRNIPIV